MAEVVASMQFSCLWYSPEHITAFPVPWAQRSTTLFKSYPSWDSTARSMNRTTALKTSSSLLDRGHWRCQFSGTLSSFGQDWQDDVWRCRIAARTKQWRRMYLGSNIRIAAMSSILSLSEYLAKSMCYRLTKEVKEWYRLETDERLSIQHTTLDFDQNDPSDSPLWAKSLRVVTGLPDPYKLVQILPTCLCLLYTLCVNLHTSSTSRPWLSWL